MNLLINFLFIFFNKITNQLSKLKYYSSPLKEPILLVAMSKSASSFYLTPFQKG